MTSATNYPFAKCEKGHDLTGEDAFLFDSQRNRRCRVCAGPQKRKGREVRGAFDQGGSND